jgi:hypothetical protein
MDGHATAGRKGIAYLRDQFFPALLAEPAPADTADVGPPAPERVRPGSPAATG